MSLTQAIAPATHWVVPAAQMPEALAEQAIPPPGSPSSGTPSQFSSAPLQSSVPGRTCPTQVRYSPPAQVWTPALQSPTPSVPEGPS